MLRLLGLGYVNNAGYGIERYFKSADEVCVSVGAFTESCYQVHPILRPSREYKFWNPVLGPMMQCGETVSSLTAHHGQCEYKEIISHQRYQWYQVLSGGFDADCENPSP